MARIDRYLEFLDLDQFTTGEAAKILGISQQTVIRCIDEGRLTGNCVPGSRFRRIRSVDLFRFAREHKIPINNGFVPAFPVAVLTKMSGYFESWTEILPIHATSSFDLGLHARKPYVQAIAAESRLLGALQPRDLLLSLDRANISHLGVVIIGELSATPTNRPYCSFLQASASPEEVRQAIRDVLSR